MPCGMHRAACRAVCRVQLAPRGAWVQPARWQSTRVTSRMAMRFTMAALLRHYETPSATVVAQEVRELPEAAPKATPPASALAPQQQAKNGTDALVSAGPVVTDEPVLDSLMTAAEDYDAPLTTVAEVREAFCCSVQARTVGNAQLRRFVDQLPLHNIELLYAAVEGAEAGGLRVDQFTYEAMTRKYIAAGQLKNGMEVYQVMLRRNLVPTAHTYAILMQLCLDRAAPQSCLALFDDMQKRGAHPTMRNYELVMRSLAAQQPVQWERAVQIFDLLCREHKNELSAQTFNALMLVYSHMEPFDWEIVFNCYHDLRTRLPRIQLEWESYYIVAAALRRGGVPGATRFWLFADAWCNLTPLFSLAFLKGMLIVVSGLLIMELICSGTAISVFKSAMPLAAPLASAESTLPL